MGILRIIKDAFTRANYQGIGQHLVPRGIALPVDIFGSGTIRYGKKIEAVLPLFVPDSSYRLAEDAVYQLDRIVLNRIPDWISPDGFISINHRELHEVSDIGDTEVILKTRLLADHPVRQPVYHYSNPVKVEGNYSRGRDVLVIDIDSVQDKFIVRGDVLAISSRPDVKLAFKEYTIVDYSFVSEVDGIRQYQVTLDQGIHRSLDDEELIQLRAYMAYKSKIMPLPITPDKVYYVSGPFLLDWRSTPFMDQTVISETQYIQKYDASRAPIGPSLQVNKNVIMLERPINEDQFLFWDKVDGDMNHDKSLARFLALTDNDGHFWMKHTCVPNIQIPSTFASGYIICTDKTNILDNEHFIIDDSETVYRFEYQVTAGYVPTPTSPATGSIEITGIPNNSDWFSLNDGFGTEVQFEYKQDSTTFVPTSGRRVIDVTAAAFVTDVVIATESAINKIGNLQIDAANASPFVNLTHQLISKHGNQLINPGSLGGWNFVGMAGGTHALETIDIQDTTTDVEVASLTSAAINRADFDIKTDFTGMFNSFRLKTTVPGITGNIPIVSGVAHPDFILSGMTGGSGGVKWNSEVKSVGQDALMRIRFFPNDWLPTINLIADVPQTITPELKSTDQPVERIDILFKTKIAGEIQMGTWNIATPMIVNISHEYVAQIVGDNAFAANGLWIKPMFPSINDVSIQLGVTGDLNAGRARV